jgi:hypothetical protein
MIVPLKRILEESSYYIRANFDTAKQCLDIKCSWTNENEIFYFRNAPNMITAKMIADIKVRKFCKKFKYPYDYVLWQINGEPTENPQYPLILSTENEEKMENLWSLYYNMVQEGLTLDLLDLANETNLYSDFYTVIKTYFGFDNDKTRTN